MTAEQDQENQAVKIEYFGHTSVRLLTEDGQKLVFDPNFSDRLGRLQRKQDAVFDPESLHNTDLLFFSNAHFHRLDRRSLKFFKQSTRVILPLGLTPLVNLYYRFPISELKAGATMEVGNTKIVAIKSLHTGARYVGARYANVLHYLIKTPTQNLLYVSDCRYDGAAFHEIGEKHRIDTVIMPVSQIAPRFWARNRYLNLEQAMLAFKDLGAKTMIPVAYGAFGFSVASQEKWEKRILKEAEKQEISAKVHVLKPGEKLNLNH